jgi:Zn finger protein HypA/HybF involved in hydrogenase expression
MKKKSAQNPTPVIPQEILEEAKRALHMDRLKPAAKCKVCGSDVAPNSSEGLCWVCRRLKISAWRDSDQQAQAQE